VPQASRETSGGPVQLRHGVQVWAFILLFGVMIPGMALQSVFFDPETSGQVIGSVALVSLPLAIALFVEARFRIVASYQGVSAESLLGERVELGWGEVRAVRYRSGIRLVVLEGAPGTPPIRISLLRGGLPGFAGLVKERVRPEAFDAEARKLFRL